jgi:hypothetical protein
MKTLRTTIEVVDALGGLPAVCDLTGANSKQAWNWIGRAETFPANTYWVMIEALRRRRLTAPPHLWNQRLGKSAA